MTKKHRLLASLAFVVVVMVVALVMAPVALATDHIATLTVNPTNSPYTISQTTLVDHLVISPGGWIVAPDHKAVTLMVGGVETGGVLESTPGTATLLSRPGIYNYALLTITDENVFDYAPAGPPGTPHVLFPFREALYVDDTGVVEAKSVWGALLGPKPVAPLIKNVSITSTGQNFDGIFVAGGSWTVKNSWIRLFGNGRSDFSGYGAAIVADGENTKLVVDRVNVVNKGVVRAAVVAEGGASVVVKNSYLETLNGVLPADYIPTIDTAQMRSVPWMLSLSGNVRTTNLLGVNTKASYINSTIKSQGWGVLSTDGCTTPTLTAINSKIAITGKDGYGSYGIGDATENFLGCTFNVASYATISRGSFLHYGDSTPAAVSSLNTSLGLGLTPAELAAIPNRPTVVNSKRFGIMWHGGGTLDVTGGTVFNTREATFLDKGQAIAISVDGSKGVKLNPANGVLLQVMDDDDPGPDFTTMQNTKVYHEPPYPPDKIASWDLTSPTDAAVATFSNIALRGDFFNSITSITPMGPPPGAGPPGPPPSPIGKNMQITLNNSFLRGVITASEANHSQTDIGADDYRLLGEVTNTPRQAINNGVCVQLNHSVWTCTGTSYLTKLVLGQHSNVVAPFGCRLVMTVDQDFDGPGAAVTTPLVPSKTYVGYITIKVVPF
jgi:hypothetical protein